MNSRVLYATCGFCQPDAPSVPTETWMTWTETQRKDHAERERWIIGKLDRLERHLSQCPAATDEARAAGADLLAGRERRNSIGKSHSAGSSKIADDVEMMTNTNDMVDGEPNSVGHSGANATGDSTDGAEYVRLVSRGRGRAGTGRSRGNTYITSAGRGRAAAMSAPEAAAAVARAAGEEIMWLQTARTLAREAGDHIKALRHPPSTDASKLDITSKSGSTDLVTNADVLAQATIFGALQNAYPTHKRIGEEDKSSQELTDDPTWVVDSIDGTTNYVHGLSDVAVSIAFMLRKHAVVGVVYNPMRNELFHAVRGRGAFLNDRPIKVSSATTLDQSLVVCEWGYDRTPVGIDTMLGGVKRLMLANVRAVRQLGSGALDMCYVACGRADAVYTGLANEGWKIWDYAAASVIVEEAGGKLSAVDGGPFSVTGKSMACSTPGIADDLVAVLRQ